jgi:hypothetical protein
VPAGPGRSFSIAKLSVEQPADAARWDGSPDGDEAEFELDQDALTPDVFERRPGARGPHIRVSGGVPGGTRQYPDGIRWVQTIDTNAPIRGGRPPYVDYTGARDDKPFYFNDADEGTSGGTFSDNPSRSANGVRWDATLSLVGVRGSEVTRIDSLKYGFDISSAGAVMIRGTSDIGPGDLVIHGDTLRSEYPEWRFGGGFAVPQVTQSSGTAAA